MFKKIIIFCFLFLFIISINTITSKASTTIRENSHSFMISEKGSVEAAYLVRQDIIEASCNYNLNEEGEYYITCTDESYNNFQRRIIVSSFDELNNGYSYSDEVGNIRFNIPYAYTDFTCNFCYLNRYYFYAYASFKTKNGYYFLIQYYHEFKLVKSEIFYGGIVKDAIISNGNLICLIEEDDGSNLTLMEVDRNIEVKNEHTFISNGSEIGYNLYLINNSIYIVCTSNSNTFLIERSEANRIILIIKCNRITFDKENTKIIGNNYDNDIISSWVIDNKIYIDSHINGSNGEYYNAVSNSYNSRMVLEIDSFFTVKTIVQFPRINYGDKILMHSGEYYIISEDKVSKRLVVEYDSSDSKSTFIINLKTNDIRHITYLFDDDYVYGFVSDENYLKEIVMINKNTYHISSVQIFGRCDNVYKANNMIYYFSKSTSMFYAYYFIQLEKYDNVINDSLVYQDVHVYCNHKLLDSVVPKDLSSLDFGNYEMSLFSYNDLFNVSFKSRVRVLLKTNVSNNGIYGCNLKLDFNGYATLNDSAIETGHIVKDIGNYDLVIYNDYGEKFHFSFEVKDYSLDLKEKSEGDSNLKFYINKIAEDDPFEDNKVDMNDVTLYENNDNITLVLAFIPLVVLMVFLVIKFFRRKKK